MNKVLKIILNIGSFLLGIVIFLATALFVLFYGTKIFSQNFSAGSLTEVFLKDIIIRYLLLSLIGFIILWLSSGIFKIFRNLKIDLILILLLLIPFIIMENPAKIWLLTNSAVYDFPDKSYSCFGKLGFDSGGRSCFINFSFNDKSIEQTVKIITSRMESKGYFSTNYIPINNSWTGFDDPEVIKMLNDGKDLTDVFSKDSHTLGIEVTLHPKEKKGTLTFYNN